MARTRFNLFDELKRMSESKDDYMREWQIYQVNDLHNLEGRCICGKEDLRYEYHIKNSVNGAETIVGSRCADKVGLKLEHKSKADYLNYALLRAKDEGEKSFVNRIINAKFKKWGSKSILSENEKRELERISGKKWHWKTWSGNYKKRNYTK